METRSKTTTKRINPGQYEIHTTAGVFRIEHYFREDTYDIKTLGRDGGWDLFAPDGEWCENFDTKREAKEAIERNI